jgi:hypothetical protein
MVQSQLEDDEIRLKVVFFKTQRGNEPVREWLKSLPTEDKRILGEDIKTAQYGWPLGMPLNLQNRTRSLGSALNLVFWDCSCFVYGAG